MTVQEETAALHLAASQSLALLDAIADSIGQQVVDLTGTLDADKFNSNFFLAKELLARLGRALSYNRTVVRQTLIRLEALGLAGSTPPPALELTPYGLLERVTGHSSYRDPAASQIIAADTPTPLMNNRSVIDESQLPPDVTTFYDGNRFRAAVGDALLYRITFDVVSTDIDDTATAVEVWMDYGAPGVQLFQQTKGLTLGYNQAEPITYLIPVYAGQTFAAQGARPVVWSDAEVRVENVSFFVTRLHRSS